MSETASTSAGYTAAISGLSLAQLGDLLMLAHGDYSVYSFLRSAVEARGIRQAAVNEIAAESAHFDEGRTFSEHADVRWRRGDDGQMAALVLTEEIQLVDEIREAFAGGVTAPFSAPFAVTYYNYAEWPKSSVQERNKNDEQPPFSPAKFWTKHETRLPSRVEYPEEMFLIYAVYCDTATQAARFTRLLPRLKSAVAAERSASR